MSNSKLFRTSKKVSTLATTKVVETTVSVKEIASAMKIISKCPGLNILKDSPIVCCGFINALKKERINPNDVNITNVDNVNKTISFSLSCKTNKSGKLETRPDYYTYYINRKIIKNNYAISNRRNEQEAMRLKKLKDSR